MCGEYGALNRITVPDRYPMPIAEEIFDKLAEGGVFSTLDLRQGFNQIKIQAADVKKTAFHRADELYEWLYMPFGLRNASAVFQRVMDSYLGYEVRGGQIGIQRAKVEVLDRIQDPKDWSSLRAVLGFLSYYRRFVPNFSKWAAILNNLLRDDKAWEWGEKEKTLLKGLMDTVKTATLLQLPQKEKPFTLYTDWSSKGMGAILCQEIEGEERVVAYASRSCNTSEAQYSSSEGKGLVAVWAVGDFCIYLQGSEFTLVTDHQPLLCLMTNQSLTGRNARWAVKLQEYDFKIKHRAGVTLQHVDGLSRNPPAELRDTLILSKC
ncbi:hypothetical protein CLOM_g5632 [Closterium sp. NIES-68]|nr:hypothetical protein CLOM_g5632 [Closterium sp. NIES-68]